MSSEEAPPVGRLLIADDDDYTRTLLKDLCESAGHQVATAVDGADALEQLARSLPEVVLLDLMMPRMDGFEVLSTIRKNSAWANIPVILITALGDLDGKIRGMELGADDYVTKPFKLVELQTRVTAALRVKRTRERILAVEEELNQLRAVDPVTGAGTFAQLKASLEAEFERSRRYGRPAALLLCTVDDYPSLLHVHGRERCNELLAGFAAGIRNSLRSADRLFRVAPDEFVLLLPETDLRGAELAAHRLESVVPSLETGVSSGPQRLRTRFAGAAMPNERIRSGEDLLREANRALQGVAEGEPGRAFFSL